ncbi:MAG: hypothetical protein ACXADB_12275 [Candidatus Hermodarchaeia archaeon]|jgi:hypothetical protein
MPEEAAKELHRKFQEKDPELMSQLESFGVVDMVLQEVPDEEKDSE